MKKNLLGFFLILTGSLVAVAATSETSLDLGATPASFETRPWKTIAASGPVESRPLELERWRGVSRGDELLPRSHVRTGDRGRVTLTREGDLIIVDPNSTIALPESGTVRTSTTVEQTTGSVLYEIERGDLRDFRVKTPYLVAGVKGTTFLVTVGRDYTSVTVEKGQVDVFDLAGGRTMQVRPGSSVLRHHDDLRFEMVDTDENRVTRRDAKRMVEMRPEVGLPEPTDKQHLKRGPSLTDKVEAQSEKEDWLGSPDDETGFMDSDTVSKGKDGIDEDLLTEQKEIRIDDVLDKGNSGTDLGKGKGKGQGKDSTDDDSQDLDIDPGDINQDLNEMLAADPVDEQLRKEDSSSGSGSERGKSNRGAKKKAP